MKLKDLRRDHPDWHWSAERYGMGWRYIGHKGRFGIVIHACAHIVGEDAYETVWMADDGEHSQSYASWALEQSAKGVE